MLELRTYTKKELSQIFQTNDTQGLKRKLSRYGVQYTTQGRGNTLTFTITQTADPFKVFCIENLGFSGQTDFRKLRDFLYYYLNDDDFQTLPDEMKATRMSEEGRYVSRQTIANYIRHLSRENYISLTGGEAVYYFAYQKKRVPATKEQYSEAWKDYWNYREQGANSYMAITRMRVKYGGVARKQPIPQFNGIYRTKLETLNNMICESIEKELAEESLSQTANTKLNTI